jgi:hypothetical protein
MSRHQSKPSMGLLGDNEQLSALDHAPLSPQQTNIQVDLEVNDEEEEHAQHEPSARGGEEDSDALSPSSRIALNLDPSQSGEFDRTKPGGCVGCAYRVLNLPTLQTVFPVIAVLSFLSMMLNVLIAPDAFQYLANPSTAPSFIPSAPGFAMALIWTILQGIYLLLATRQLIYQLVQGDIKPMQIVGLYLSTILFYANIYEVCLLMNATSFGFTQGSGSNATTNVVSIHIAFIYYSVSTITSTGFGDIFPRLTAPKLVSSSELLLALFYHVGIFTIGLKHFQEHVEAVDAGATSESQSSMVLAAARTKMRELRTKYPRLDAIRKWFIASVFPVSAIIQAVFLIILHISDPDMFNRPSGTSTNAGLIFIFFIAQVRHSGGGTSRGWMW